MLASPCASPVRSWRDWSGFCRGDGDNAVQSDVDHQNCILTFVSGIINLWHIRKSLNGTVLERNNCLPIKMNTDV